jgi:hypothetical protein
VPSSWTAKALFLTEPPSPELQMSSSSSAAAAAAEAATTSSSGGSSSTSAPHLRQHHRISHEQNRIHPLNCAPKVHNSPRRLGPLPSSLHHRHSCATVALWTAECRLQIVETMQIFGCWFFPTSEILGVSRQHLKFKFSQQNHKMLVFVCG